MGEFNRLPFIFFKKGYSLQGIYGNRVVTKWLQMIDNDTNMPLIVTE